MPPRLFLMTHKKDTVPLPEDLRVFLTVIRKAGFAAAACTWAAASVSDATLSI